jgi:chitin disaccharide deacetylase
VAGKLDYDAGVSMRHAAAALALALPALGCSSAPVAAPAARPEVPAMAEPAPSTAPAGIVYLTFDDGPIDATLGVLDVLASRGVKATFFVNGFHLHGEGDENEGRAREALLRLLAEGHVVGNHSYDHMLHNCCQGGQCGAVICNQIGRWSVGAYRDSKAEVASFTRNVEAISAVLPAGVDDGGLRLAQLARLPYTNAWRTAGIRADCPCCTSDDAPPWDPNVRCSAASPSASARMASRVADELAARGFAVLGWDLEWSPADWGAADAVSTLASAEAMAAGVAAAMAGCGPTTLQPAHTRAVDFPCGAPESSGKVILLTHDFLFEDGKRGRGATENLPKLARLIDLLATQGYRFETLDRY